MRRSFRFQLATRFTLAMALGLVSLCAVGWLAGRDTLDRDIDSTLLSIASIQASAVTSAPEGRMEFHEWELTPREAAAVREVHRYAQVWTERGESLLRTRYITEDLPLDSAALARAVAGELVWTVQEFQGARVRTLYYPLGRHGAAHARHVLQLAAPLASRDRILRDSAVFLAGVILFVSAGTFAGGWWLADRAIRPVHDIIDQAEAIRPGDPLHRIHAFTGTREYQRLIDVLNTMLGRLDAAHEAQRRFTADASHELRSPLTALRGELELAQRRDRSPQEYRRVIGSGLEEVERLCRVADDLLTLARSDAGMMELRLEQGDLARCAAAVVERLQGRAREKGVMLGLEATGDVPGYFDPDLVSRLVWNLTENAIKFTPPGGAVRVRVSGDGQRAELSVEDTGPGLPPGALNRLFERFYRSDTARTPGALSSGTGLGLSIARAIAELHGGRIEAANREATGAVFRVELPLSPGPRGAPA